MVRKLLLGLGVGVGFGIALFSLAPPAAADAPRPLLWKVADADNEVYLLGSFHLLKAADYPLAASVDGAFADAESLVFELSPKEMSDPALGQSMARAALRSDGKTLQQSLPEATWRQLEAHAGKRGLPLENLQQMEAWFVGLLISIGEAQQAGLESTLGLDRHFMQRAEASGKPATGLESGAEQIALFDGMSEKEQTQALQDTLDELGDYKAKVDELHGMWRAGDAEGIHQRMATEMQAKYPELYRRINLDRNRAWLPRIKTMLARGGDDQDVLVVVGSLHLLGPGGLVELLRAEGYTVTRQ